MTAPPEPIVYVPVLGVIALTVRVVKYASDITDQVKQGVVDIAAALIRGTR